MFRYLSIILYLTAICVTEGRRTGRFGRRCLNSQKRVGVCMLPASCSTVHDDLVNHIFPQICRWNKSLYCCVQKRIGKKSNKMCKKYEDLGFITEKVPTLLFDDEDVKTSICPYDDDGTTVIYGGEEAKLGEFPHMALIGYEFAVPKWKCGGSLVSERFVLSAGHCLYHREYGDAVMIRLGDLNFTDTKDDMYVQDIPIKNMHSHPQYKYPSAYHDIALFELEFSAKLSIYVKPICIYTKENIAQNQVLAVGWGDTEKAEKGENDMLMKVVLNVYDKKTCSETYSRNRIFQNGLDDRIQVCVGSSEDMKDTCQGDSGGPILIKNKDVACSYYILGITSHGKGCGNKLPSVYTRIYPYIEWIENIIYKRGMRQ